MPITSPYGKVGTSVDSSDLLAMKKRNIYIQSQNSKSKPYTQIDNKSFGYDTSYLVTSKNGLDYYLNKKIVDPPAPAPAPAPAPGPIPSPPAGTPNTSGTLSTFTGYLQNPSGLCYASGYLYTINYSDLLQINATTGATVSLVSNGGGSLGYNGIISDENGNIYVSQPGVGIFNFNPITKTFTSVAVCSVGSSYGIVYGGDGNAYFTSTIASTTSVFRANLTTGTVTTLYSDSTISESPCLFYNSGYVYVGFQASQTQGYFLIINVSTGTTTNQVFDNSNFPFGIVYNSGYAYIADRYYHNIIKVDINTWVTTLITTQTSYGYVDGPNNIAKFNQPTYMCLVGTTLYLIDSGNYRIRKVVLP